MAKQFRLILPAIFILLLQSCSMDSSLTMVKELNEYPSGSAIEYIDGKFYIAGDDATYFIVLDKNLDSIGRINAVQANEHRIPKKLKPDFEAITAFEENGQSKLLVIGSGSYGNVRNKAMVIDITTGDTVEARLDTLFERIYKDIGIINIEAIAKTPNGFVMGNRGNIGFKKNHLVLLPEQFWKAADIAGHKLIEIEQTDIASDFSGISGCAYLASKDWLLITASTENTSDVFSDGDIGKSFLWIIKDFKTKKTGIVKIDLIIDLESLDSRFKGQKVESVCIIEEGEKFLELAFVADNDEGSTWIGILKYAVK